MGQQNLQIETGRWCGLQRDERICKMCDEGEVEDVEHFLLHCNGTVLSKLELFASNSAQICHAI